MIPKHGKSKDLTPGRPFSWRACSPSCQKCRFDPVVFLLSEEAIALDPEYAAAYLYLGSTHFMDVIMGSSKSPKESLKRAFEFITKAKALDASYASAHSLLGFLYVMMRQYDKGIAACERAIVLEPNSANAHIWMGLVLTLSGRHEEAVRHAEQALRLDPFPPPWYYRGLGHAYFGAGRYGEAIGAHKKALQRTPDDVVTHTALTSAYSCAGRLEEARAQAAEVLRINPKYSVENAAKRSLYKKKADRDRFFSALRKAGLPETPPLPLPDKPSIAVLPFVNMSDDPKQEYLSDGITEQIITSISKIPRLFVIARTSSFKYKGKAVDVKQVGRELGVKYVLEGSVQRSGDRLRITAQLIDAITGKHLWAERYDRRFKELFALQDEITMKIMVSLALKLTDGERVRLLSGGTDNLKAYEKALEGVVYLRAFNIESNATARQLAEEAIALDLQFAGAYSLLAVTHIMDVHLGSSKSPRRSLGKATKLLQKAIALDENYASAHSYLCHIYGMQRQYEKAIAEGEKAVALNPNSDDTLVWLAMTMDWAGRSEEAIALYKKAMRLCPFPPSYYYLNLGHAYRSTDRCKEAITEYKKALHLTPNNVFAFAGLAISYSLLGQEEEVRAAAAELLRINPKFSLKGYVKRLPHKDQALKERWCDALHKAGLK